MTNPLDIPEYIAHSIRVPATERMDSIGGVVGEGKIPRHYCRPH